MRACVGAWNFKVIKSLLFVSEDKVRFDNFTRVSSTFNNEDTFAQKSDELWLEISIGCSQPCCNLLHMKVLLRICIHVRRAGTTWVWTLCCSNDACDSISDDESSNKRQVFWTEFIFVRVLIGVTLQIRNSNRNIYELFSIQHDDFIDISFLLCLENGCKVQGASKINQFLFFFEWETYSTLYWTPYMMLNLFS